MRLLALIVVPPSPGPANRTPQLDRIDCGNQAKGGPWRPSAIKEEGKNGTVEVLEDRIVRTRKKLVGKDDVQTIPIKAVSAVSHDRKTLGTDEVKLTVGSVTYEWKVKNAEEMVAELHGRIYGV